MDNPSPRTFNLFKRWRDAPSCLEVTLWTDRGFEIFEALISKIKSDKLFLHPLKGSREVVLNLRGAILFGPSPTPEGKHLAMVVRLNPREVALFIGPK